MRHLTIVGVLLLTLGLASAQPASQTHPWRIGVIGGYCTGYLGLLSLHGLPHERIDDAALRDLKTLQQYQMIIVGVRGGAPEAEQNLEEYVRGGGIALVETVPVPSAEAMPGERLGPFAVPNLRFVDSGTPITAGLPELGVLPCVGFVGASIIPPPNDKNTVVIANYTDEDAPKRCQGNFVRDGKGTPAILMTSLGKGKLIYAGPSISFASHCAAGSLSHLFATSFAISATTSSMTALLRGIWTVRTWRPCPRPGRIRLLIRPPRANRRLRRPASSRWKTPQICAISPLARNCSRRPRRGCCSRTGPRRLTAN
jgi:hypothetical protein